MTICKVLLRDLRAGVSIRAGLRISFKCAHFPASVHLMESVILCRNHRFSDAFQQDFLSDPGNCPLHGPNGLQDNPEPEELNLPAFFKQVLPT